MLLAPEFGGAIISPCPPIGAVDRIRWRASARACAARGLSAAPLGRSRSILSRSEVYSVNISMTRSRIDGEEA